MKLRKTISFILIILLLLNITGCTSDDTEKELKDENINEEVSYEPVEGGEIVVPLTNLSTLNPLMTENISYYHFSKLIFEGLFDLGNNLNIIPKLAQDYNIINEGKTISIRLRKDIKWHDGADFNANDVAFTINTLKYAKDISSYNNMFKASVGIAKQSDINMITEVKILDDYNMEINFADTSSNNLELLTFPIIPQHLFKDAKNPFAMALELENFLPIGTGPYKFEKYEKLKNINLISFEQYWDGKPYITNILGKVLEDDKLILTAFETGQLSIASSLGIDWDKYKSNKRINVVEYISNNYEFVGFNFEKEIFQGESGLAIRKAINYGIDRQAIISKIYLGHASQIDVPIHPDSWLLTNDANTYGYSLEIAKGILNEAKWIDRDNDGILENEEGEKLSIKILTNSYNQLRLNTSEMIVEDLSKLGFEVVKDYYNLPLDNPTDEEVAKQWEEINLKINAGDFDLVVLGWEMAIIPNLSNMFHSSQVIEGDNFIGYNNEKMDELLLKSNKANNREYKKSTYGYLQGLIVNDLPYVSLFYKNKALLVDSKIIGDLNPTFFNPFNGLKDCFIPEDLR